ncbi:hypothetical protein [uncultured Umboniibacter sp.]|uniref:tetratricopeptide repeat protein n=1 Tax=uncultured Umboniibacter sp. TaxID=1798917 RepID=UPI00261B008A|nr:hypothetical protein [uncultured Umboniibacter sp.]
MKNWLLIVLLCLSGVTAPVFGNQEEVEPTPSEQDQSAEEQQERAAALTETEFDQPLYKPFIERYVLDEIRALRIEMLNNRVEISQQVAANRVEANDKSIAYTAETMTIFFYIMAGGTALVALVGWNSLRDVRAQVEGLVNSRVDKITAEYERRLAEVEAGVKRRSNQLAELSAELEDRMEEVDVRLKKRSEQIMEAQEDISRTNELHALWLRAGLEIGIQARIDLYDQILKIKPDDIEAITYKADLVLENGDSEWALSLCNQAIDFDQEYAYAYWQRACANATLGRTKEALRDLYMALEKSPRLMSELETEEAFASLRENEAYVALINELTEEVLSEDKGA